MFSIFYKKKISFSIRKETSYLEHEPNKLNILFANDFGFRSQYFSNQGQVDQAAVIPNIDNVQQENFVPRY